MYKIHFFFFFQAEDGIRDRSPSRGLGDVYKRQALSKTFINREHNFTIEQFEQIMTFDSDDGMQKKWKAFKKKIDVKMEEFPFILQSINEFLCEPYTAVIKGTVFEKYWDANECSWN